MSRTLADLFCHPLSDRHGRGDYHRLVVVDSGSRGYDVVLRIDGGYAHPADAEAARPHWQRLLDTALTAIEGLSA